MPRRTIDKIRDAIRKNNYDLTYHAIEEMADDELDTLDIENAILNGKLLKIDKNDPLGTKYIIRGIGKDQSTLIGIVGRFKETGIFLIITVYEIT
ncbi:MAG: DUF4258 domain-containing protein [candidate division KSB1 bacterium]|nr:DUF4258 domain-containing protein [candidate division KSB1 bacterium]